MTTNGAKGNSSAFWIWILIQFNWVNDYENAKSDFPINASLDRVFVA
jgi:hypothetical protein